jgi:hypothetical protein
VANDIERVIIAECRPPEYLAADIQGRRRGKRCAGGRRFVRLAGHRPIVSLWIVHADATDNGEYPAKWRARIFYIANKDNSDILI